MFGTKSEKIHFDPSQLSLLEGNDDTEKKIIDQSIVVFAHSMGGPTTREYIHSDFYQGDIDKSHYL